MRSKVYVNTSQLDVFAPPVRLAKSKQTSHMSKFLSDMLSSEDSVREEYYLYAPDAYEFTLFEITDKKI